MQAEDEEDWEEAVPGDPDAAEDAEEDWENV